MTNEAVPHLFSDWDMPHIGRLYQEIRESRRLSKIDVATWAETTPGTVTRFEETSDSKPKSTRHFESFINALCQRRLNGKRVRKPLKAEDVDVLKTMYAHSSTAAQLKQQQDALASIDFRLILEAHAHEYLRPLAELLEILRVTKHPAFIADSLWFIHAINGATYNLFDIHLPVDVPGRPRDHYLDHWEAWHIMAAKFFANSPIRDAHRYYNDYFPPTVDQFFRMTAPILFTVQMRALVNRLMHMSDDNDLEFTDWWLQAVSFDMSYKPEQLHRQIKFRHPRQSIEAEELTLFAAAVDHTEREVSFSPEHKVKFWLGLWQGTEPKSQAILDNLPGDVGNQQLFYAAHFDVNQTFHANTWPEVVPSLEV